MSDVSSHTEVKIGSERSFGIVFAIVFAVVALWPPIFHAAPARFWALVVALVFLIAAFLAPALLKPLNRLWFQFGMLLSKIVSPIVMGIIFFITVTPIGLIRRRINPDPLNQKFDREANSYWIRRDKETMSSMRKQF